MARPSEEILAARRGRPGWENAVVDFSRSKEKNISIDKGDGSGRRAMTSRSRRVFYRDDQGNFQPIDTEWKKTRNEPWEMKTNRYRLYIGNGTPAGSSFLTPRLLKYDFRQARFSISPRRGIFFENGTDTEQIAQAKDVNPVKLTGENKNVIRWRNAYGPGVHYDMVGDIDQVWKRVVVADVADLGTPTITGPVAVTFPHRMTIDDDTRIFYRNKAGRMVEWDRTGTFRTDGPIVFREAGGRFLFAMRTPFLKSDTAQIGSTNRKVVGGTLRDPFGTVIERISWLDVTNANGNLNVNICFNWNIVKDLTGRIVFDPTIDTEAVNDTSDAEQNTYGSSLNTGKNWADVQTFAGGDVRWAANFDLTGIGASDTIDTAYLTVSFGVVNDDLDIRVVEDADHPFPADYSASATAVSNWSATTVAWTSISSFTQDVQSPSIISLVEDWRDAGGTPGEIGLWMEGTTNSAGNTVSYLIGYSGYQEEIYVEYTVASSGSALGLVNSGLVNSRALIGGPLVR